MESKETIIESLCEWGKKIRPSVFGVSGGEPLLHPDFIELMAVVCECFPDSIISVVTNGALLDEYSDDELRALAGKVEFRVEEKNGTNFSDRLLVNLMLERTSRFSRLGIAATQTHNKTYKKLYDIDSKGMAVPSNSNPAAAFHNCCCNDCRNIIGDTFTFCSRMALLRRDFACGNIDQKWYRVQGHTPMTLDNSQEEIVAYLHRGAHPECALCPEQILDIGAMHQIPDKEMDYIKQQMKTSPRVTPEITADNSVFTAVAAYPNPNEKCFHFIQSAKKCGVSIEWLSWGEEWHGFNYHKLQVLQSKFKKWREAGKQYVFMHDSKDVVFADPLETIIRKANDIYEPGTLLFNDEFENYFYPYKNDYYKKVILSQGVLLNSGLILGHIDVFDKVITHALEIMDGIKAGKPRMGLATFVHHDPASNSMYEDDQLTYQICTVYYPHLFRVDKDRYLFSWVRRLNGTEKLEELRREPITNGCVGTGSIIHSSSTVEWAGLHVWDKWVRDNILTE
jgi:hypothetical protein